MNLLVITDPKIPVPPPEYGGAERIAGYICAELKRLGHRVDLMAGPGSKSFGGRLIVHRVAGSNRLTRGFRKLWFHWVSRKAASGVDVIVNFGRLDYLAAVLKLPIPLVCRFGNPVSQSEIDWLLARRKSALQLIGVSQDQIKGLCSQELWNVVHNATDMERFPFADRAAAPPYLAFLGRITANKGADTAIRVARRSGMKLKLAGNISDEPGGREFFEREIKPQLGDQVEWVGPVNDDQKRDLLGGAAAMLFPIRWSEPFANVVVESLACGTPVIATRCASTPEVIESGKTGFLCDSEDELVEAVKKIPSLNRAACRQSAEERFSVPVMTQGYLRVLRNLIR